MNTDYAKNIKLNTVGDVDINYHIDVGHQLRAEYMAQAVTQIKAWLVSHLSLHGFKLSGARLAHH
ncbi:MAG: hypothetical protein ISR73_02555 [Gammaproteobacteria bacterium]|nr:hypothetical protein [Gammaproteobacteria bacterium]